MRPSYANNEFYFFYHKLDAEYFHVKQFFPEKVVFSEEIAKYCFGTYLIIF